MRIAIGTRKGLWTASGGAEGWEVSQPLKDMAEFASVAWIPSADGADPFAGSPTPLAVGANASGEWRVVSAGWNIMCGIGAGGAAYCWGDNTRGSLGNGTTDDDSVPSLVARGISWTMVSAGGYWPVNHACGVSSSNDAYCWGYAGNGQLGNGTRNLSADDSAPGLVVGGLSWSAVTTGGRHSCGITTAGAAYCWGENTVGQLGDGSNDDTEVPVPVSGGHTWRTLTAGRDVTCGVTTQALAYCWGDNSSGQLGNGTQTDVNVPTPVADGSNSSGEWVVLDPGYDFTCGVGLHGGAYCWGGNFYGQLGNGTRRTSDDSIPVQSDFPPGEVVRTIGTGVDTTFTCASTDTDVYCWGENYEGTIGNPSEVASAVVRPVLVASSWQSPDLRPLTVSVGGNSSILLTGTSTQPTPGPLPVPASPPRDVVAIAGDASALVTWLPPASPGSFSVTNYLVTAAPGGRICLMAAPSLTCTVSGLTNDTAYTFTVKALTGAGWSPASAPSNAVVPRRDPDPSILITGSRDAKRIVIVGSSNALGMGAIVVPWTSRDGAEFVKRRDVLAAMDGSFTWSRRAKADSNWRVYVTAGNLRSNTVLIESY